MESRIVKADFKKLDALVKNLHSDHVVRVGIFGNKTNRRKDEVTNADLGAKHEFGDFSNGIPKRSWLRMPIMHQTSQILKDSAEGFMGRLMRGDKIGIMKRIGKACERAVLQAFDSRGFGSWKPNAPSTIRRKKSDSPLIDTGQLRRATASQVVKI